MNEEIERIRTEEESYNSDADFAVLRKLNRDKEDPQEKIRGYLRAVEDAVEQNDNSFDGIINNLPDEAKGSVSGTKDSLVEEIRREAEKNKPPAIHKPAFSEICREREEFP